MNPVVRLDADDDLDLARLDGTHRHGLRGRGL